MRPASLLIVLLAAKAAFLRGHSINASGWLLVAYVWQDAAVALFYALFDRREFYWLIAIYAAINVPVERALSTPLTWPMLRAARGPLADSILLYVNGMNCALVVAVLAVAFVAPLFLGRMPALPGAVPLLCAVTFVLVGPSASSRVDTHGLGRNAITALVDISLPRVAAFNGPSRDWRSVEPAPEDLSRFAGVARGRNVIMVSLESTAAQYLELYGAKYDVMPNLSKLANRAVVFDNAYAVYPESIKALSGVLCSTYSEKAGCRSIASVFAGGGYRTGLFHSGRFDYLGMDEVVRNRGFETLEDAGEIGGDRNSSFGVDEPATVARMLAWIDAEPRGRPFFLMYLPIAGHHPYPSPQPGPFPGADEMTQYRNALHYGDVSLGVLMNGLRARGLADDTVWVVYGDHGEAFGQHDGNFGHTFFLYEENVHVPFLIAAPGLMERQERVRKIVSAVDLAPTILDLAGLPLPGNYEGKTLLDSNSRMTMFFTDYSLRLAGLRDEHWKFIYEIGANRSKLFDLEQDPGETEDVSAREQTRVSAFARILKRQLRQP
ncbi:MAG TPA: sulfatase [Bryobacteraceae bacterium]|nr:sulfatase [Bryobacteraceae bacterium]